MLFIPIKIEEYVKLYMKNNPGSNRKDVVARLKETLAAAKAGARCSCGAPIWVIGSAEVGHMCFTCITGEAIPDGDYEIADACRLHDDTDTE
jgi:hypothetical protein